MLSMAGLKSAAQAGSYYSKDNYYTQDEASAASEWTGAGAREAGLDGPVDVDAFTKILNGELPDGTRIGVAANREHRPGMDMTFSAPKSVSVLALVGGDERLAKANLDAARATLVWAEKNLAEARVRNGKSIDIVKTGNLTVAMFQHDTSRNLDPQLHVHAVVANATRTKDGEWRALHNDNLWKNNVLLGQIYHSWLREKVEALGYQTEARGKHGTFEIVDSRLPSTTMEEFSTRRQDMLAAAEEHGIKSHGGMDATALRTRARKEAVSDREALRRGWQDRAAGTGADLPAVITAARDLADRGVTPMLDAAPSHMTIAERGRAILSWLQEKFATGSGQEKEPYFLHPGRKAGPADLAAAQSVAMAVRHLSEREASFNRTDIASASLRLGMPTNIDAVERQVDRMARAGILLRGFDTRQDLYTTPEARDTEARLLVEAEKGQGAVHPVVADKDVAGARLQALAKGDRGFILNAGQESAGRLLLASTDRIVTVQGVAGAGKSSVLKPVADIARQEGRAVLALGVQNKLVAQLKADTGIESRTIASFVRTYEKLLGPDADATRLAEARARLGGAVILVDESSMISNKEATTLARLANLLDVGRMAFVGDFRQLGAVQAGKPFEVMQKPDGPGAEMSVNIRARDPQLQKAGEAANTGRIVQAFDHLRATITEAPGAMAETAADRWLALSPDDRQRTLLMTSGRALMHDINARVQQGLHDEGTLTGQGINVIIRDRVIATREEMRAPVTYEAGMQIHFRRNIHTGQRQPIAKGWTTVIGVDRKSGEIRLRDANGHELRFDPTKLPTRLRVDPVDIARARRIRLHDNDSIRWTDTDKDRGLIKAELAKVLRIAGDEVTIANTQGVEMTLKHDDPMLKQLDLAYAMNTHQLQGATAERVIAAGDSRETRLTNARLFLVNITRPRDGLELIIDDSRRYRAALGRNAGDKSSALETLDQIVPAQSRETILATPAPQAQPKPADSPRTPEKVLETEIGDRQKQVDWGL